MVLVGGESANWAICTGLAFVLKTLILLAFHNSRAFDLTACLKVNLTIMQEMVGSFYSL